ncbi:hypothetical protein PoB_006376300 [Plakobranchus ocellatus]|uniref:Uncharacterized protein n=1 Tax=Plakobranchus ocellatus TaxID=259542 RepID=A0AAV4CZA3_9GAST|nr:hypothetical protein PoB_006376300 [Plakobranchus ocellatus]
MTKSEGRKSFSIDALLARTTSSSASAKLSGSGSNYSSACTENYEEGGLPNGSSKNSKTHPITVNNNIDTLKGENNNFLFPNSTTLNNVKEKKSPVVGAQDILESQKALASSLENNCKSSSDYLCTKDSRLRQLNQVSDGVTRAQVSDVQKSSLWSPVSKDADTTAYQQKILHDNNAKDFAHRKQENESDLDSDIYRQHQQSNSSYMLSSQQQVTRSSVVSSSSSSPPPLPSSQTSPSSNKLDQTEKSRKQLDAPLAQASAPSSIMYPADLRLGQFPVHPFHPHFRPHHLPGGINATRLQQYMNAAHFNNNSSSNSSSNIDKNQVNSSLYRHHHSRHHEESRITTKDRREVSPLSPDRPTSGVKSKSPAPSPSRSAHSGCSSPRSRTPESPPHSPRDTVDRGSASLRPCSPSPQAHSPLGGVPPTGGFIPRPGLLGLSQHGLVSSAGHLGFQVTKFVSTLC